MLLDHEITFWTDDEEYNPKTHEYGEPKEVASAAASVTDMEPTRAFSYSATMLKKQR